MYSMGLEEFTASPCRSRSDLKGLDLPRHSTYIRVCTTPKVLRRNRALSGEVRGAISRGSLGVVASASLVGRRLGTPATAQQGDEASAEHNDGHPEDRLRGQQGASFDSAVRHL